uniref:Uncharacterized protein n=1 Tax=Anguilla anguilla TaxID=7936 RepID=A0A0E9TEE6_ANGAN
MSEWTLIGKKTGHRRVE